MSYLVSEDDLPVFASGQAGIFAHLFNGADFGLPEISVIFNRTVAGDGAPWHRHTYDELFLIGDGHCVFTFDDEAGEAGPGQLVLAPANAPHTFRNPGPGDLRMTAIHAAPRVVLERLDRPTTAPSRSPSKGA